VITVTIHDIARGGSGVARLESGEIIFVPFTAPGDVVTVNITEKNKNYSQGEIVEIVSLSPMRVPAPCPVFQKCGGCTWQHLPYELQFKTKKSGVLHALKRAGIDATTLLNPSQIDEIPAKNPFFYRNRIQLRGNPKDHTLGFYEKGSTRVIPIQDCKIARTEINAALPKIREEGKSKDREYKVEIEVSETGEVRAAWNQKHAAFGFRQVNDEQNQQLQEWVAKNIGSGELLLDLFGGSGNLSRGLVDRFSKVECVDTSVPKEKPKHLPAHYQFHRSSTAAWLQNASTTTANAVSIILDPPREGLGSEFSQIERAITQKFSPKTLLLVGCDPDSFARDVSGFIRKGYTLERLGVLDLFPQTPHVESLAVLKGSAVN